MRRHAQLVHSLRVHIERGQAVPLLVLRHPEFAQVAWQEGKRVAQRLERSTAAAFREATQRIVRDEDQLFHEPGRDWFAVGMFAPARGGALAAALDARTALERIAAAMSLRTGRRMETGWWQVSTHEEIDAIDATIERALERGARERERFEFLATVGHELRTPLTSIRGYIETLLDDDVDAETTRRFLETARREALRLGRLVDGMLEFSLLDLGPRAHDAGNVNVAQQVRAAIDALAPIARDRSMTLRANLPDALFARIDPDACMHAIVNLLENALKYGHSGGCVVVLGMIEGSDVAVFVDDDGPGIRAVDRESVFALRHRAGEAHVPGSGIGLAIVKTIVEHAGGSVSVHDSPLGGARFHVRLPRGAEPAAGSS